MFCTFDPHFSSDFDMSLDLFWNGWISWNLVGESVNCALFCFWKCKFSSQGFERWSMTDFMDCWSWILICFCWELRNSLDLDGEILCIVFDCDLETLGLGLLAARSSWIWVFKSLSYLFLVSLGFLWPLCSNRITCYAHCFCIGTCRWAVVFFSWISSVDWKLNEIKPWQWAL